MHQEIDTTMSLVIFRGKKIRKTIHKKESKIKITCRHDYKNAIKVGNIDYQCPSCGKLVDPNTWFIMNSFEFIEVEVLSKSKKR